jgi:hypothetical protein
MCPESRAQYQMNIDEFNQKLLESVGVGLVITDYPDLKTLFHNQHAGKWFPALDEVGGAVEQALPGLDCSALRKALEEGERHSDSVASPGPPGSCSSSRT